jgi:Uma2 family endonuclease
MSVPAESVEPPCAAHVDQRVTLHGVDWDGYEALLALRGDAPGMRITYLEGDLELMTPSIHRERMKSHLARLLEAYAEARGIELQAYGSWTVRSEPRARGVQADECYVIGVPATEPARPDIAIEVVWTSGGLEKLEVYRGLGVPEVWVWQNGGLRFHVLHGHAYTPSPRSALLPGLDPALMARCMGIPSQTQAVIALRRALRQA